MSDAHLLRSTYGLGRSTRAKLAPLFLSVIATIPALAIIAALVLAARFGESASELISDASPVRYDTIYSLLSGAGILGLFCAAQAPELFGRDQRHGILSLYFSRALRRTDYTLARILGFVAALVVLLLLPQVVLFLGRVLLSPDVVEGFRRDVGSIPPILAQTLLVAFLYGGLAMAVSAYTPRRAYAVAGIIALFVIPDVLATVVVGLGSSTIGTWLTLISPNAILAGHERRAVRHPARHRSSSSSTCRTSRTSPPPRSASSARSRSASAASGRSRYERPDLRPAAVG